MAALGRVSLPGGDRGGVCGSARGAANPAATAVAPRKTPQTETARPPGRRRPPAAAAGGPPLFGFGPRYSQRTEPVDAGVGRAKIDSGMEPLKRRREAGLEPAGIPRFLTVIEGPGQRIEQVWDESTPWPLYS